MLKYVLAALALKAFSRNDATKNAYCSIGNVVGQRARQNTGIYVERGDLFVALCKKDGRRPGASPGHRALHRMDALVFARPAPVLRYRQSWLAPF